MKNQIKKLEKQIKNLHKQFVILKETYYNTNIQNNLKKESVMENIKNEINIYDIGKYLLENCPKIYGTGITQLQKLLYYAQAEYLIHYNKCLFNEDIQAWPLGPVVATVYFEFVKYHSENKDIFEYKCSKKPLPNKVIEILKLVINKHGEKDGRTLIKQTHNEDPWKTTYHPNKKFSNAIITPEKILKYFSK